MEHHAQVKTIKSYIISKSCYFLIILPRALRRENYWELLVKNISGEGGGSYRTDNSGRHTTTVLFVAGYTFRWTRRAFHPTWGVQVGWRTITECRQIKPVYKYTARRRARCRTDIVAFIVMQRFQQSGESLDLQERSRLATPRLPDAGGSHWIESAIRRRRDVGKTSETSALRRAGGGSGFAIREDECVAY